MNQTSVLIIGAGPVGMTLACELARRNVALRIIERSTVPQHGSRAKGLQPRSLEIFNDLGFADYLLQKGSTELPFRRFFNGQPMGDSPRPVFLRNDTRYPKTLLISQLEVEAALRTKLQELGAKIEWGTELTGFTLKDNSVECQLESTNSIENLSCTYMVACDGGKSTTRKKLGIGFAGETHEEEQLWVGDVELEGLVPDAWYNWLSSTYGLAYALFPFKGTNTWQVQAVVVPDENGKVSMPTLESFYELFKERTQMNGVTFTNSTWQSIYRVNVRRADKYRVGNAFIAGDAAHVHSIAGGVGMNTGVQDVYNLGWKLAAVLNSEANDSLLDTYAEERIPIADWLLTTTSQRQQTMLNAATKGTGGIESIATADTTQLNLNYRGSSLSGKAIANERDLQSGDRAPDAQLADGTWLSDNLNGSSWKLLLFGNHQSVVNNNINNVTVINTTDPAVSAAYGLTTGFVLVRPDGYIALIASEENQVDKYFQRLGKKM